MHWIMILAWIVFILILIFSKHKKNKNFVNTVVKQNDSMGVDIENLKKISSRTATEIHASLIKDINREYAPQRLAKEIMKRIKSEANKQANKGNNYAYVYVTLYRRVNGTILGAIGIYADVFSNSRYHSFRNAKLQFSYEEAITLEIIKLVRPFVDEKIKLEVSNGFTLGIIPGSISISASLHW